MPGKEEPRGHNILVLFRFGYICATVNADSLALTASADTSAILFAIAHSPFVKTK